VSALWLTSHAHTRAHTHTCTRARTHARTRTHTVERKTKGGNLKSWRAVVNLPQTADMHATSQPQAADTHCLRPLPPTYPRAQTWCCAHRHQRLLHLLYNLLCLFRSQHLALAVVLAVYLALFEVLLALVGDLPDLLQLCFHRLTWHPHLCRPRSTAIPVSAGVGIMSCSHCCPHAATLGIVCQFRQCCFGVEMHLWQLANMECTCTISAFVATMLITCACDRHRLTAVSTSNMLAG